MTTIQKIESRLTRSRLRQGMAVAVFALAFCQFLSEGRPAVGSPARDDAKAGTAQPAAVAPVAEASVPSVPDAAEEGAPASAVQGDATAPLGGSGRVAEAGERVVVGEGEVRPRAQFLVGGEVDVDGSVSDVFALGGQTTIRGVVRDNAFLLGGEASLEKGTVEGDLHAMGGDILIDGEVMGDVYAFGGDVVIAPGAVIHGDLTLGGGELTLDGTVHGSIRGGAGEATLNGTVDGDVNLHVGEFALGPAASIGGNLTYESPHEADITPGAAVAGTTQHALPPVSASGDDGEDEDGEDHDGLGLAGCVFLFIMSLLFGFAALAIGGQSVVKPSRAILDAPAPALGWGFVAMILMPTLSAIVFLPIVTIPVGILGFILWFVALYVARLVTALAVGLWLFERFWPTRPTSRYLAFTVGLVIHYLISSLPVVWKLELFLVMVVGLGGIVLAVRGRRRTPAPPPPAVPAVA